MWWGLGIGIVVGALIGEWAGAVVCGFLGWLIGLVVDSQRKPKAAQAPVAPPQAAGDRLAQLEARVVSLEARLATLDGVPAADAASPAPAHRIEPSVESPAPEPAPAPEPEPAPEPAQPARPNPIVAWFTGGNAIARVGIVVLFIGIAFLLRYAVEHSLVPPELRIAGIGLAGIVLLGFGWRLRSSRPGYALSLQGAGVGVLYLTVFGAMRLYHLIPPEAAFPLLVAIAVLATWLAVRQDSAVLAGFGVAGGFVAPVLASTGRGDHVMLFSYFAVLNCGILATAWFRSWRALNLLGFAFTFVIGLAWGARYYRPQYFATVEPFLVFFFLLYVAVAVLFARRESSPAGRVVDGTLVFGVPLVGFGMQAGLVKDFEYGLAFSSLALAAFYLALAAVLNAKGRESWRLLVQSFLALGVVFATVAIPLAFDARWTSAAWAVEGAAVLWMGAKQGRRIPQAFGLVLQLVAGLAFFDSYRGIPVEWPVVNGVFLGCLLIAAAGLFSHRALRAAAPAGGWRSQIASALFIWALLWGLLGAHEDFERFLTHGYAFNAHVALAAAVALAFAWLHRDGAWKEAAWPSAALLPVLWVLFIAALLDLRYPFLMHPFAYGGWAAWPFAIAAHLWARRRLEGDAGGDRGYAAFVHSGTLVLVAALGAVEAHWASRESGLAHTAWSAASLVLVPALLLVFISSRLMRDRWPLAAHPRAYRIGGALPIAAALWAWIFVANATRAGPSDPLPYLPLLNAIDLGHGLIALAFAAWWKGLRRDALELPEILRGRTLWVALGIAAFAWANGVLLRSLHHWADVPYHLDAWMRSFLVQSALSIFWSVLALGLMVYATRRAERALWMIGAALMAVVVAKLALVDLARLGGLERIVSFIGVGILMLVIGYFSPVPPRRKEAAP